MSRRDAQAGFTYLAVMLAIAILGVGLATASEIWSTTAHRQRLVQADWAGRAIVRGIASYHEGSPGAGKRFPESLEVLLSDPRWPVVRRHLRSIPRNPLDAGGQWYPIRGGDGRIVGVATRPAEDAGARPYVHVPPVLAPARGR